MSEVFRDCDIAHMFFLLSVINEGKLRFEKCLLLNYCCVCVHLDLNRRCFLSKY